MKKIMSLILILTMVFTLMTGCGTVEKNNNEKISIVTTIYPEYDWVMNVLGDKAENFDVQLLMADGVDLHSFQPSVDDIVKISSCDLLIFVGGESDSWVKDAVKESQNENMITLNLMDIVSENVKCEEIIEGMEPEHEEEEIEEPEYDEHIWLSLKNASSIVDALGKAISKLDSNNDETYLNNAAAYIERLKALDSKYVDVVDGAKRNTIIFGDRFPFRYLVDDYEIKYYAAFLGCSADSEASFETVTFLANKVAELELDVILTTESDNFGIAKTIMDSAKRDAEILSMNSMQSVTKEDIDNGITYLSIMESNLLTLGKALN